MTVTPPLDPALPASADDAARLRLRRHLVWAVVLSAVIHAAAIGGLAALTSEPASLAGAPQGSADGEDFVDVTGVDTTASSEAVAAMSPPLSEAAIATAPSLDSRPAPKTISKTAAAAFDPPASSPTPSPRRVSLTTALAPLGNTLANSKPTLTARAADAGTTADFPDVAPPVDAGADDASSQTPSPPARTARVHAESLSTDDGGMAVAHDARPASPPDVLPGLEAGPAPLLTIGIIEGAASSDGSRHSTGSTLAAGNPALAAFMAMVQHEVGTHSHLSQVYREAHPNFRNERVTGRSTTLRVRVRGDGTLESVTVDEPSGSPALDQEAIAAVRRAQPHPRPPAEALDGNGGFSFRFRFHLDLTVALFLLDVNRVVATRWRPSPAFRRFGGNINRTTIVRVLLAPTGKIVNQQVQTSSGIDFLDATALEALPLQGQLVAPPSLLQRRGHLVPLRIKFVHGARGRPDLVSAERERRPEASGPPGQ